MELSRSAAAKLTDLLPREVLAKLQEVGKSRNYRDGALIQRRGDSRRGISILQSGNIIVGNIGMDGSFVVSSVLQPGECFGEFTLFAGLPRTHDLTASGAVEVLYFSERVFLELFDSEPSLGKALLAITLRRTHDLLEFLDGQRRLSVRVRLAKVLLSFLSSESDVRCRQEELAYLLGVTRVTVNKALKSLADEGFVRIGYGVIEVVDEGLFRRWVDAKSLVVPVTATVLDS